MFLAVIIYERIQIKEIISILIDKGDSIILVVLEKDSNIQIIDLESFNKNYTIDKTLCINNVKMQKNKGKGLN